MQTSLSCTTIVEAIKKKSQTPSWVEGGQVGVFMHFNVGVVEGENYWKRGKEHLIKINLLFFLFLLTNHLSLCTLSLISTTNVEAVQKKTKNKTVHVSGPIWAGFDPCGPQQLLTCPLSFKAGTWPEIRDTKQKINLSECKTFK